MKFKGGPINNPIAAEKGDLIRLTYTNMQGKVCIHEEKIQKDVLYTHWVFLSMDEVGFGIFMGNDSLYVWVKTNFPTATEVFANTPVLG